jgi:hypothetical protein
MEFITSVTDLPLLFSLAALTLSAFSFPVVDFDLDGGLKRRNETF